ncbi:MAG TPA: hypothetical protein VFT19_04240 [Solirubrobacterales bacterium]|nr:hypothetical protein [Solirubrobacterales bacterium]
MVTDRRGACSARSIEEAAFDAVEDGLQAEEMPGAARARRTASPRRPVFESPDGGETRSSGAVQSLEALEPGADALDEALQRLLDLGLARLERKQSLGVKSRPCGRDAPIVLAAQEPGPFQPEERALDLAFFAAYPRHQPNQFNRFQMLRVKIDDLIEHSKFDLPGIERHRRSAGFPGGRLPVLFGAAG